MNLRSSFKHLLIIVIILAAIQCSSKREVESSIHYPQPLPDSVTLRFLPGIVSSDSLDFNAAYSPDGNTFYFSRTNKGKWMIYMTTFKDSVWSEPVLASFNETQYSQADPFFANDGTLFYISNRPRNDNDTLPDFDIWFVRPQSDGAWTKPQNAEAVNSDSTEYYMSVAANGNLYFASNRAGSIGSHDIYVSRFINGAYTTPVNLGPAINSDKMEHDPMISPDEQYVIFTSVDRADTHGNGDLYYSLRQRDGTWTFAKNMGKKFNTDTYEYCSYITPDQQYLFYSSDYDVKWISTRYLPWNGN